MRILFCNWRDLRNPAGGGSEKYIEEMAAQLVRAGHQVTIACAQHEQAPHDEVRNGIRYVRRGSKLNVYLQTFSRILFRRYGPIDVVVDVQNGLPFFTRWATRHPVIVLVHHVHREQWPVVYPGLTGHIGWWIEHWLAPRIYRKCQYITVSEATRSELHELGVDARRVHVVHNGTDRPPTVSSVRSSIPTLVVLGRLVPHKQVEHAIDVVAALLPQHRDLTLNIIGDGWWREKLETYAVECEVSDQVLFHGFTDERSKHELLAQSWAMALPSLKEGWGIAILEAASHGVPTVAYRSAGGTTESIIDGVTGILADSPHELASAVRAIIEDNDLRSAMASAAVDHARSFTWEASARRFSAIIESTHNGRERRPIAVSGQYGR